MSPRPNALTAAIPQAVRSTRLPAPPAVVWARVCDSRFVGAYLGVELPDVPLEAGRTLQGRDAAGRALTVSVVELSATTALTLRLNGAGCDEALSWSITACDGGSRVTVLHGPVDAAPAHPSGGNVVLTLLARPLSAILRGPEVGDEAALAAARSYLDDSARAVQGLLELMPAHEGYRKPAADRFSLVEHLWHLADVEEFGWARRLPRVLLETLPALPGVDGDRLAVERRYQQRPWRGAARRFVAQRRRALAVLARFDSTTLQRPVRFGGGCITAEALLAAMLAHDDEHRLEMAQLWRELRP